MKGIGKNANGERSFLKVLLDAAYGRGIPSSIFIQMVVSTAWFLFLCRNHPTFSFVYWLASSLIGRALVAGFFFWIAPLNDVAYAIDRLGALRAQVQYMAPYALDLLPTLPKMIPFTQVIVDNIEVVGPFIPTCMQPSCKEHMLPVLPILMSDIEVVLPIMDSLKPALPHIAPHINDLIPFLPELLPYTEQLLCIVYVDGWHKVNPYLSKVVPHLAKVAPHAQTLAKHLPKMLPYMDTLMKHFDNMVDQLDETVEVLDKLVPLLPLIPAADMAGLLSQKIAFKALPTVIGLVPLPNQATGIAAQQAANAHAAIVDRASKYMNRNKKVDHKNLIEDSLAKPTMRAGSPKRA